MSDIFTQVEQIELMSDENGSGKKMKHFQEEEDMNSSFVVMAKADNSSYYMQILNSNILMQFHCVHVQIIFFLSIVLIP